MEENNIINVTSNDLPTEEKQVKPELDKEPKKGEKSWVVFLIFGILGIGGGVFCILFSLFRPREVAPELTFPKLPTTQTATTQVYSDLTGEPLADPAQKTAPAFCMQVPNGTDGARPHSGLKQAGVIFEAIAEAGITRFAAIFQEPTQAVIGPIRSLRLYFLNWDVPFDCTIVHAGGADDAIEALRAGGYRHMNENYYYMYRGTNYNRLWNNLFTTATLMKQFNADYEYGDSNINGFTRMTPEESKKSRVDNLVEEKLDITKGTKNNTSNLLAKTSQINLYFGGLSSFNVVYNYDVKSNTYLRSYESGADHEVYRCADEDQGERNPEDICTMDQMAPSVVIAVMVEEHKADDNYHENIANIGSGEAFIFQNGIAIKGTWSKPSREEQIRFTDENGAEIRLAPGQTMVSAIPQYGGVDY